MSILRQVLNDAWTSIVRKSPSKKVDRVDARPSSSRRVVQPAHPPSSSGLKVVILNWKAGENDPFTVLNQTIRWHLQACGKNTEIVEITEQDWANKLVKLAPIEFAFTWQGLGSTAKLGRSNESLWDHLKIPLLCIHGDHPSHMPLNHELESPYCYHLYTNADFARYSNRHFRRIHGAGVIDIPQLHREPRLHRHTGDYFVLAKNINDPRDTEQSWRERLPKSVFETFMMATEALTSRTARESYVELHDVLDDIIVQQNLEWLTPETNPVGYHDYHSQLDHHLRSHKTVAVVNALGGFPVRIYGRGWERFAQNASPSHIFERGRDMASSQELYYSRFGLVDISPSKGLHDRTRRAMANEVGFLSSAYLEDSFPDARRFDSLFFTFRDGEMQTKADAVLRNPDDHSALAREFAHSYHAKCHFRQFVNQLDHLAKIATNGAVSST